MEVEICETVEVVKLVSIDSDHIEAALAVALDQAREMPANDRMLCRVITAAYQVFEAASRPRLLAELKPEHRKLVAEKLREQAERFEKSTSSGGLETKVH
jgi:hypothetical protein